VVGRTEEHEATVMSEPLVGDFARGDGLATEGLDRIDVELSKWKRVLALQEARRPDTNVWERYSDSSKAEESRFQTLTWLIFILRWGCRME
jgi:hypothetical protein